MTSNNFDYASDYQFVLQGLLCELVQPCLQNETNTSYFYYLSYNREVRKYEQSMRWAAAFFSICSQSSRSS